MLNKLALPESSTFPGKPMPPTAECWFDDACILDMDYFVKTISGIKAKGVRPDLVGSIIAHYASKWLPDLSGNDTEKGPMSLQESSPESVTVSWMKKRFFVETLVGILPPERDSIPCNFLLRLLRTANMVGVEPSYRAELEKRISWQLDQASLKELMIPSFSHTCGTLLDVELVIRLVKRFASLDEGTRSGIAVVKVAKLVDSYLAEAALDTNLSLEDFIALGAALPSHARAMDDGLYRAIDTYLKAHPGVSKQDRKVLCRLIDSRKLSPEASLHAAQNERLEAPVRCMSKREMNAQQMEIKKLKEELLRVQSQCVAMQMQMEKLVDKKKGFFRWKKLGIMPSLKSSVSVFEKIEEEREANFGRQTPIDIKQKPVRPPKWRKSMS
ncbi:hypothetical protein Gotri_003669 [Gossypium trilobum]|uniref:NPH3 domain-containing protein n=1 Tax=Gossypium trilobum TaxID=34281 RepID=A0A7J9F476_9ROSI|nr:hypothetical protein [Gossypium trilobum]